MANLINAEAISIAFGTRVLLDRVSLGLSRGDVIGVVGRNGDGKTTLLEILTGAQQPDSGRVTRTGSTSIGYLAQTDSFAASASVRDVIVGGEPDHVWAANAETRAVVHHLLADIGLEATVGSLSGGERRRTALVALMLGGHDLLVLDEPTNHLDVEAVAWLAEHLRFLQARDVAMLVVSHDRWFLDAICTRIWEVHDAVVDAYDGGYAAYVLARAERSRQAAGIAARRKNLLRKELAWLRRGPPARTSKPKFRIDAANTLIADEPPPRDKLALQQFSVTRLGKDVFDLVDVTYAVGSADDRRVLLDDLSWSIGPGMRIGVVGVNGTGKTSLLRLLMGELTPDSGHLKRGRTLQIGHLSQNIDELGGTKRVLEVVEEQRRVTALAGGGEASTSTLLEDFGFTQNRLTTRLDDLSGGERRRLQFLRLLLSEPNVLLLDEPTNDLDIDTLTVIEDYLDTWPGTLIVVSHDRYFLERVCDVTYALIGGGRCVLLPGGVEQYLADRRAADADPASAAGARAAGASGPGASGSGASGPGASGPGASGSGAIAPAAGGTGAGGTGAAAGGPHAARPGSSAAEVRQARKELARLESQLAKLEVRITKLHAEMATSASDYTQLAALQTELDELLAGKDELEAAWLEAAEVAG